MKKKGLIFYCITLMLICQYPIGVSAISESKMSGILAHCDSIKDNLKKIQQSDSRTRVYLGGYYERILTKFIVPLNVRLVENNLSDINLIENQNSFAESKEMFATDFIRYQQSLEGLIAINCKDEPEKFYEELLVVRKQRKMMEQDVLKIRSIISSHLKLVGKLMEEI